MTDTRSDTGPVTVDAPFEVMNEHFMAWYGYWGELVRAQDDCGESVVYGFESCDVHGDRSRAVIADLGACFGFCSQGAVEISDRSGSSSVHGGQWFTSAGGCDLELSSGSRVVISQRVGWLGLRAMGGPIEEFGRLRYIDRCSDTVLAYPPVLGDPCLNHLHFPPAILQTEHWHPSTRAGIVAAGRGECETPYGYSDLVPGIIFYIPSGGLHRFITHDSTLDVIAYHPDSDWGPTDEDHPMVNRTWIGEGQKVDNSSGVHLQAEIVANWSRAIETN